MRPTYGGPARQHRQDGPMSSTSVGTAHTADPAPTHPPGRGRRPGHLGGGSCSRPRPACSSGAPTPDVDLWLHLRIGDLLEAVSASGRPRPADDPGGPPVRPHPVAVAGGDVGGVRRLGNGRDPGRPRCSSSLCSGRWSWRRHAPSRRLPPPAPRPRGRCSARPPPGASAPSWRAPSSSRPRSCSGGEPWTRASALARAAPHLGVGDRARQLDPRGGGGSSTDAGRGARPPVARPDRGCSWRASQPSASGWPR